jgi:hypothetical protein
MSFSWRLHFDVDMTLPAIYNGGNPPQLHYITNVACSLVLYFIKEKKVIGYTITRLNLLDFFFYSINFIKLKNEKGFYILNIKSANKKNLT